MSDDFNVVAWLAWAFACVLLVVNTRNPLYLALVGLVATLTYLSTDRANRRGAAWGVILRIGLAIAGISVLFNLLTVHTGDHMLTALPRWLPIVGGTITLNALVYGVVSGMALGTLLLVAATFNVAVDRGALLRAVPGSLTTVGVALVVGLSFFPQTIQALETVREAQAARGFRIRSARDLRAVLVPVLHLGLERAFDLAETLESRGFGARGDVRSGTNWLAPASLVAIAAGVALVTMDEALAGAPAICLGLALAAALVRRASGTTRGRLRPIPWRGPDRLLLGSALVAVVLTAVTVVSSPDALGWSPYPTIVWPPFQAIVGLAVVLLAAPLVIEAAR